QPEALEQVVGAAPALAARRVAQRIGDVLPRAQVAEERVVLEDEAAAAALGRDVETALGVQPGALAAAHHAARGAQQARDAAEQRALARARRAGERQARAVGDAQAQVEGEIAPPRARLNRQHGPRA